MALSNAAPQAKVEPESPLFKETGTATAARFVFIHFWFVLSKKKHDGVRGAQKEHRE